MDNRRYFQVDTETMLWQALKKEHIAPDWSDDKWLDFVQEYQMAFCESASQIAMNLKCDYDIVENLTK